MPPLRAVCVFIRKCFDKLIDGIFSIFFNRKKQIPDFEAKHRILLESAVSLATKIKNKELKSEQLVTACIERIKQVNPVINAVTDERFDAALRDAQNIDQAIESGQNFENKPFLGVPFTAKESFAMEGMLHTLGVRARKDARATEDADCVRTMKEAGAIPLAVTNIPEVCKWIETRNMVFGQTRNPYHTGRTSGGSSGGEAALHASIAIPISLCGDTGGSTRMPAFYCGLYALNPTSGYTSNKGTLLNDRNRPTMGSVAFLSRHCSDLIPLVKVVTAEKGGAELDLDRNVDIKKLKYYYVESAGDKRVSPINNDLRNAMTRVINVLKETLPKESWPQSYTHDGFDHMFKLWRYRMSFEAPDFPMLLTDNRRPAKFFVELAKKIVCRSDFTFAAILGLADKEIMPPVKKEWAEPLLNKLRTDLIALLGSDGVLLFPSSPYPAPYHYVSVLRPFNFAYWAIFNALQFPSVQVPVGLNSSGLPLGIQIAAGPKCDALCVAVAEHVSHTIGSIKPPCRIKNS